MEIKKLFQFHTIESAYRQCDTKILEVLGNPCRQFLPQKCRSALEVPRKDPLAHLAHLLHLNHAWIEVEPQSEMRKTTALILETVFHHPSFRI
jgi:hypothetical protein